MRLVALMLLCVSPCLHAESWKGAVELGFLATSGNTDSRTLNAKLQTAYESERFKNNFVVSAITNEQNDVSSAERYTVGDKLDYKLSDLDYLFAAVDYEKDLFGGVRERTSEALGYGRRLLTGEVHQLEVEAGLGARQTQAQLTRVRDNEFIGRLAGRYLWTLSATSAFQQSLKSEIGADNTFTEAVSEIKFNVVGRLFAGFSYTLRNNSDVPVGTERTDAFTALTLSYALGDA